MSDTGKEESDENQPKGTGRRRTDRSPAHIRPSGKGQKPDTTATLQPLVDASPQDWLGSNQDPDVMLAVPNLGVDYIGLDVENLHAHVELHARVLDLLELHVGADVGIDKVHLEIDNVRVQAMLKVKLDKVVDIVDSVMTTIDNHPEILSDLTGGIGRGVEKALAQGHGRPGDEAMQLKGPANGGTDSDDGDGEGQREAGSSGEREGTERGRDNRGGHNEGEH